MKTTLQLPAPIESYLRGINGRDADAFQSGFADDAIVRDGGREIRGIMAIADWAKHEIFGANVSLELLDANESDHQTIITVKIDGTFDRTGLPDPLVMEHCFTIAQDKITSLTCRLAREKVS